jgi:hypothetical protein
MRQKAKDVNMDINKYVTNMGLFLQYTADYYEKETLILKNMLTGEVS